MKNKRARKLFLAGALAALFLTGCSNNTSSLDTSTQTSMQSTEAPNPSDSSKSVGEASSEPAIAPDSAVSVNDESSLPESSADSGISESIPEESVYSSVTESTSEENPDEAPADNDADTPYGKHGALSVNGAYLTDSHDEKIQLRGMSTHGIAWFPEYVNYDTFKYLRDEWNTNCIRLAMYTYENGGYCSDGDKEKLKELVRNGVDYASQLGMYVIVDWHILNDQNPLTYKDEAVKFFDEMSKLYADKDNVIYEICNEPNSSASWEDISAYANEVIPVIRANDPNSVILVGTPTWSQEIDKAAAAPLDFDNIMYTLHFYAATHTDWLRNRMESCINGGLPVFISEFGTCDASGNGQVDAAQSSAWKDLIDSYNVSYMCWNLANKNESSSIIASSCTKLYGWSDDELSTQGRLIRDWFVNDAD